MLRSLLGQHHLTNNTCTSDLLLKVAGIIVVDLPAWFDHEQEKSNASPRASTASSLARHCDNAAGSFSSYSFKGWSAPLGPDRLRQAN